MKRWGCALYVFAMFAGGAAFAQPNDEDVPSIVSVEWRVCRDEQFADFGLGCFSLGGFFCPSDFGSLEPIDLNTDLVSEQDVLIARIVIQDDDFDDEENEDGGDDSENIYVRRQATWFPVTINNVTYDSPQGPPIPEASFRWVQYEGLIDEGVVDHRTMCLTFTIPRWIGRNQARLRGEIDFDVAWLLAISIANDEDPEPNETFTLFDPTFNRLPIIFAVKDRRFLGSNPQAIADAGADNTVVAGSTVMLDASRTFDAWNVGFSREQRMVFDADQITYTWEWVSGPVRVEPVYPDPVNSPQVAEVTLTQVGTYVYRVTADDNFNALPTQDTVTITVVSALPPNRQPVARITGPLGPVTVGTVIHLDAAASVDPDGDALSYRWVQTDELGSPVDTAIFRSIFQPLGGLNSPVSSWQALRPGTYFFRLIVSDGSLSDTELTSVTVVEVASTTSGGGSGSPRGNERDPVEGQESADPTAVQNQEMPGCGAGVLAAGFVPLACFLMRRRF